MSTLRQRYALIAVALIAVLSLVDSSSSGAAVDEYPTPPDAQPQPGVPKGTVQKYSFANSRVFPGTQRDYWVYVPAQYTPETPACVYVNQDGIQHNAPAVFDNLIAKKEMPVTIGIFVTPGVVPAQGTNSLPRFNRSYEYDTVSGDYARFLLDELLPEVERKTTADGRPIRLSADGNDRCIGGLSSGAICAFTVAWERPDAFSRVFSGVGTYVGLRGGDVYSTLVRKSEPKPIRVFLQDGANDLNIYAGDWWMANQTMERALRFAGYETEHVWGEGFHNGKHAAAVFPDAMRFLWKDWPVHVKTGTSSNSYLTEILIPGETWQSIGGGYGHATAAAANSSGEVMFNDLGARSGYHILTSGTVTESGTSPKEATAQAYGPDGKLYSVINSARKLVTRDPKGGTTTLAKGIRGRDVVVRHNGVAYVTEASADGNPEGRIWRITPEGKKQIVDTCLFSPTGITVSPDQTLLYVADLDSFWVYSYQIVPDGSLTQKQRYFHLHQPQTANNAGAAGMCCDTDGRLYVVTTMGVQVCDQAGRVECIIPTPKGRATSLAFGGAAHDTLFVACGENVYKRKTRVHGALPFGEPTKPAAPRL